MASGVAKRYAKAVFELGKEQGNLDAWQEAVDRLDQVLADPQIREYLVSPRTPVESKTAALDQVLAGSPAEAHRLGQMLVDRKRLDIVPGIKESLAGLILQDRGVAIANVTTATELTNEQRTMIEEQLAKVVGREVQLETTVDPSIMGGVVARIGDVLIDGSVSSQLRRLHERLTATV